MRNKTGSRWETDGGRKAEKKIDGGVKRRRITVENGGTGWKKSTETGGFDSIDSHF